MLIGEDTWSLELAKALAPNAEPADVEFLERALRAYVPLKDLGYYELVVGLLDTPPSTITIAGRGNENEVEKGTK